MTPKTTKVKSKATNNNTNNVIKSFVDIKDHCEVNDIVYLNSDIFDKNCFEQDGENSPYIYSGIPKSKFKELKDQPLHIKEVVCENGSYWYVVVESIYMIPQCYLKIYEVK